MSCAAAAVTFVNALVSGELTSLRIAHGVITAIGAAPQADDGVVDLEGDRLLPGLINAHEHLQLNNLPRAPGCVQYRHVRDWISDINARRRSDPEFEAQIAASRDERLLIGGIKNLLSGVTTVAHHDPLYPALSDPAYPIQVIQAYGWSHSLYIDGEDQVAASYRSTPAGIPWIIHAAEGVDQEASEEFERLDALGCIGPNTLLVHGIALDLAQRERLRRAAAGLIWCPSSNMTLFGETAQIAELLPQGRVALGTDSRLSGARDLLDELRCAQELGALTPAELESLVTYHSARLLRLTDRGVLRVGARADILILPADAPLGTAQRTDVRLVLISGGVRYGERRLAQRVDSRSTFRSVAVDGTPKILAQDIAVRLSGARAREAGVEVASVAGRAA